jgi:ribosomal protein S18 acetylase RimI-like enzyme
MGAGWSNGKERMMATQLAVPEPFSVRLDVTIRPCQRSDLQDLEWFGLFSPMREVFLSAFSRYERGENMMFVAETNQFPAGQVWVDLVKLQPDSIGVIWALRVIPPLQNLGIGSRLIATAESLLRHRGYRLAELGVEKTNPHAKRLYERLGYKVVKDNIEEWDFNTPEGQSVHMVADEWIMRKQIDRD